MLGRIDARINLMLGPIDARFISIAGHAIDIISMIGIYYCCRDKEPWWALAATPLIAVPWLLIKVMMDRRKSACPRGEEDRPFASQPPPATLNWLNNLVEMVWKTHRSFANQVFMKKVWPVIQDEVCNNSMFGCSLVDIKDFDIGSFPPRVLKLSCVSHTASETDGELLLHMEVTFNSNASITLDWLPIPVTVKNIEASSVHLGLILKRLSPSPPFIGGFQIFLLEEPDITWETAGMAKMTDIPGIESLVDYLIEDKIRGELVLPNRISVPLELPEAAMAAMSDMGLKVPDKEQVEEESHLVSLSVPMGVVQVIVVEAEGLEKTDFGFKHWTMDNVNPLRPRGFSFTDLLPKTNPGDPYVLVRLVHMEQRSQTIDHTIHPKWNFECEFPVDLAFVPANLEIKVFDEDINIPGIQSDDALGHVTENIATIRNAGNINKWYYLEGGEGRIHLKLKWIPLDDEDEEDEEDPPKAKAKTEAEMEAKTEAKTED